MCNWGLWHPIKSTNNIQIVSCQSCPETWCCFSKTEDNSFWNNRSLSLLTRLRWQVDDPAALQFSKQQKRLLTYFGKGSSNVTVLNFHSLFWQADRWAEFTTVLSQDESWCYADAVMTFLCSVITAPGTFISSEWKSTYIIFVVSRQIPATCGHTLL